MSVVEGPLGPIHITMTWDMGGYESDAALSLEELGHLIRQGKTDGEGRVTSLVIWITDALACTACDHSPEQHMDTWGPCQAKNCECLEYTKP